VLWRLEHVRKHKLLTSALGQRYLKHDWRFRTDDPRQRSIRIPVENSFINPFLAQEKLLAAGEKLPSVRVVVMLMVINYLATGKRLLPDHLVRCADKPETEEDIHMCVGCFNNTVDGITIDDISDNYPTF